MKAKCTKTFELCSLDALGVPTGYPIGECITVNSEWYVDGDPFHENCVGIFMHDDYWLISTDDGFFDNHFEVIEK